MIKRSDGVEVMNARTKNVATARQTLAIVSQGHYTSPSGTELDISQEIEAAVKGTILYEDPLPKKDYTPVSPVIEVTNETTANAAVRLAKAGKQNVVALNFASARNPGGGFLAGAIAQEEDLCRCSALYNCTKNKPLFYNKNILCDDTFYTNSVIYSPNVPFFRDEHYLFLEQPFLLSIISVPAPNISSMKPESWKSALKGILRERAVKVLQIAEQHGHKNIILGAWGCGAFGNDPVMVAEAFALALEKVPAFEHVCFAVYDTREPPVLFETFKEKFDAKDIPR